VIAKLGSGVYSSVYKVRRILDGQFYALKKVKLGSLNQKEKENALNEAILLAAIHHPNIIGYREAIIDEESASLW
jgi:NIMA (never in mitosis gene a)-related kinase